MKTNHIRKHISLLKESRWRYHSLTFSWSSILLHYVLYLLIFSPVSGFKGFLSTLIRAKWGAILNYLIYDGYNIGFSIFTLIFEVVSTSLSLIVLLGIQSEWKDLGDVSQFQTTPWRRHVIQSQLNKKVFQILS